MIICDGVEKVAEMLIDDYTFVEKGVAENFEINGEIE